MAALTQGRFIECEIAVQIDNCGGTRSGQNTYIFSEIKKYMKGLKYN